MSTNKTLSVSVPRLSQPFSDEDHRKARQTIIDALSAMKTVRSRNPNGQIVYVQEPLWEVRLPAAIKVCEFVGGKPVAMTVTANLNSNQSDQSFNAFMDEILQDPKGVDSLVATIRQRAAVLQGSKPIPVEVLPVPAKS